MLKTHRVETMIDQNTWWMMEKISEKKHELLFNYNNEMEQCVEGNVIVEAFQVDEMMHNIQELEEAEMQINNDPDIVKELRGEIGGADTDLFIEFKFETPQVRKLRKRIVKHYTHLGYYYLVGLKFEFSDSSEVKKYFSGNLKEVLTKWIDEMNENWCLEGIESIEWYSE